MGMEAEEMRRRK